MAKAKSKFVLVLMKSVITRHKFPFIRPRLEDKAEILHFDPYVRQEVLYREMKKIRSVKEKEKR